MSTPIPDYVSVGQVRLLMADVGSPQYLTDEQVGDFLTLNEGSVRRAAADALDAIATSETLISKVIKTQDLATNGPAVAADLRTHADRLRGLAEREEDGDIFGVVGMGSDPCWPEHTRRPLVEWDDGSYRSVWGL